MSAKNMFISLEMEGQKVRGDMKDLLGGKGAGLAEMTNLGVNVPPGFTITTDACIEYFKNNKNIQRGSGRRQLKIYIG